jgi:hypothetical protein
MKILADESVDREIVNRLRKDGHDVDYVAEMSPGIMDEEVLLLAGHSSSDKLEIISLAIVEHGEELLSAFSVITEKAIRIRRV